MTWAGITFFIALFCLIWIVSHMLWSPGQFELTSPKSWIRGGESTMF